MNLNDMYPSTSLKSSDFEDGEEKTLTIKKVEMRSVGQGETAEVKPSITFEEIEQNFVCNKTNGNILGDMFGTKNVDVTWVGKKIILRVEMTKFQGKDTPGIRVKKIDEKEAARKAFWDYASDVLFLTAEEGRGILKENGGDFVRALAVMKGEQPEAQKPSAAQPRTTEQAKPRDINAALMETDQH